jgi:hypothetical protein
VTAKFTAVGFREPDAPAGSPVEGEAPRGGKGQIKEATARRESQVQAASEGSDTAGARAGQLPAGAAAAAPAPADKAQRGVERITRPEAQ